MVKLDSHQRRASVFQRDLTGVKPFVYVILKHSALFNAIRFLNLFHHNTKIPERNILCSITTKLTNSRCVKNARDAHIAFGANPAWYISSSPISSNRTLTCTTNRGERFQMEIVWSITVWLCNQSKELVTGRTTDRATVWHTITNDWWCDHARMVVRSHVIGGTTM